MTGVVNVGVKKGKAPTGPFGAGQDVRLRQLASGAWEIGGPISDEQIRKERVRLAAYFLWEYAGRPEGRAEEFWLAAEKLDAVGAAGDTSQESTV
jgi:hypothetical protein